MEESVGTLSYVPLKRNEEDYSSLNTAVDLTSAMALHELWALFTVAWWSARNDIPARGKQFKVPFWVAF